MDVRAISSRLAKKARRRTCAPAGDKTIFETEEAARKQLAFLLLYGVQRQGRAPARSVYECEFVDESAHWHLSTSSVVTPPRRCGSELRTLDGSRVLYVCQMQPHGSHQKCKHGNVKWTKPEPP